MTTCDTHPDRLDSRHGFSLVELLLVLAVLVCAAMAVWPRLEAWREVAAFDACVDQVRNELQQARLTAIETGHPVIVRHAAESRSLRCFSMAGVPLRSSFALPAGVVLRSVAESLSNGRDPEGIVVEFRPDGTAASRSLTLSSELGFAKELRVDRATGSVFVRDVNRNGQGE
jgi:prepilin-type N-terminal cleavage/methylation domain-containing protein